MKVIDEKGKIFGRLNIIDLIVLVLVVAVLVVLAIKITGGGDGLTDGTKLTYTVEVQGVRTQVYEEIRDQLAEGPDQLMASGDMLNANVISVRANPSVKSNLTVVTTEGAADRGTIQMVEDDLVDLIFTIEATVSNNVTNEVGPQEVRVGKTHIVKTTHFELENGVILTCQTEAAA